MLVMFGHVQQSKAAPCVILVDILTLWAVRHYFGLVLASLAYKARSSLASDITYGKRASNHTMCGIVASHPSTEARGVIPD